VEGITKGDGRWMVIIMARAGGECESEESWDNAWSGRKNEGASKVRDEESWLEMKIADGSERRVGKRKEWSHQKYKKKRDEEKKKKKRERGESQTSESEERSAIVTWACEKTVVMWKQPGHLTSMK
jgi:hypothetical protein